MTDDATLSDFASDDSSPDSDSIDDGDGGDNGDDASETAGDGGSASAVSDDAVPSAADETDGSVADSGLSTYAWGEYACDACERVTVRVWRADGDLVCPDCKEW